MFNLVAILALVGIVSCTVLPSLPVPGHTDTSRAVFVPIANGYVLKGCYTDKVDDRTLPPSGPVNGPFDVGSCTKTCRAAGNRYAGVENRGECYCGDLLGGEGSLTTLDTCEMTCVGNLGEYCGGPDRLLVYVLP